MIGPNGNYTILHSDPVEVSGVGTPYERLGTPSTARTALSSCVREAHTESPTQTKATLRVGSDKGFQPYIDAGSSGHFAAVSASAENQCVNYTVWIDSPEMAVLVRPTAQRRATATDISSDYWSNTMTVYSPLAGRRAIVTGASSGIGAATARLLAAQGARVALVARSADRLDALRETIEGAGGQAVPIPLDLAAAEADVLEAGARQVVRMLGGVDLVVNAAGILSPGILTNGLSSGWERQIDLNLTGLLRFSHVLIPDLLEAASIIGVADLVTISSVAADQVEFGAAVYAAAKAALSHLSRHLRQELATRNVRVTDVRPGMVATELRAGSKLGMVWEEDMKTRIDPLTAEDVAQIIAFAVSRPHHVNLPEVIVMPAKQV
ncbi:SDR family NAD(P)-dependent oxidoreductase [Nonomuraea sp. MG754425]|uniref:SDR family oxidoreductase n=1 Tax=Nonomuraea sp. MG754425 TaxID=2570319 RepID=UPI001F3C0D1C|nr:SDR family NAD(P)-dependent oxidoreductase [Nonomuraea sp. MG754425]MCF6476295.1 SDR family NAD(P)-dependent oxidoreductase [Nonomuraea sp. MG754425]